MRISGPGPSLAVGGRREAGRAGAAGGAFSTTQSGGASSSGVTGAGPTLPLTSLDALMTLQAVPDAPERRRRAVLRGNDLLDRLEELRLALLDGQLPADTLLHLRAKLESAREETDDAELAGLLAEVETRAAVELAKLERDGVVG